LADNGCQSKKKDFETLTLGFQMRNLVIQNLG
jgi:hypothetical protein